jgi:hypothetical protein
MRNYCDSVKELAFIWNLDAETVRRICASVGYDDRRRSQSSYAIFDFQE